MRTRRWLTGWLLIGLALVLSAPAASASPAAQAVNLSFNGGFEEAGTAATATGWTTWWQETPRPSDGSLNYAFKPSWNVEKLSLGAAPEFVLAGNNSQRVINNWDPWWAGVKQVVSAPAGSRVRLTANARVWTANSHWPTQSDTTIPVRVQVGLDPGGTDNQFSTGVAWSNAITPHNAWQAVSVETVVGASGRVGVFLSADYRGYSRQFMAAFWDEVSLVVVTGGTAVPGATNTFTPTPTRTATPITGTPPPTTSATATATATASPLPSVTSLPPTPTGVPAFYVIKPGDTLGSIARRFGLSLRALIAANNIQDANRIFVGQVLVIRGGATPPPSATVIYVVQAGDNLTRIARRYNTTVAQIKAWNNLRSDVIFIGQRLVVGP